MVKQKKICIAGICNPQLDTRVTNISNSLKDDGYKVTVIGFDWYLNEGDKSENGTKIFSLDRKKPSIFFYLKFVSILLRQLIEARADLYFAEDIQSLPVVVIVAKIFNAKIIYNSREIYAFIGGLRNKPLLQKIITIIERYFIKKVDLVLTTGEMDTEFLKDFYKIENIITVRNVPLYKKPESFFDFRKKYNIADDILIILYQGIIVDGRGIVPAITALQHVPNAVLILLGDGPNKNEYERLATQLGISNRIIFAGAFKQSELSSYTAGADVGITLIENISVSYYYALPNKLFEYIMADLPVLSSSLPQMKKIVEQYNVGKVVNIEESNQLVGVLKEWASDKKLLKPLKENCSAASKVLNWQKEYQRFKNDAQQYLPLFFTSH